MGDGQIERDMGRGGNGICRSLAETLPGRACIVQVCEGQLLHAHTRLAQKAQRDICIPVLHTQTRSSNIHAVPACWTSQTATCRLSAQHTALTAGL